jgi:hypothetical protein
MVKKLIFIAVALIGCVSSGNEETLQFEIQAQFISCRASDLQGEENIKSSQRVLVDVITSLRRKGDAKVLNSLYISGRSGVEASAKSVHDLIYPTDFTLDYITNNTGRIVMLVKPTDFATRECGVMLTVLPEVDPAGDKVRLKVQFQSVADPTWKAYMGQYLDPDGKAVEFKYEQPFFRAQQVESELAVRDGQTVIAGGGLPEADGQRVSFLLLTAKVVNGKGNGGTTEKAEPPSAGDDASRVAPEK